MFENKYTLKKFNLTLTLENSIRNPEWYLIIVTKQ